MCVLCAADSNFEKIGLPIQVIDIIRTPCYNEAHVWKRWMSIAEERQKDTASSILRNVKIVAGGDYRLRRPL